MLNTSNTLTKPEIKSADHNVALPSIIPDQPQELNMPEMSQLAPLLGGMENLKIWLNTPHPVLGGRTPQSYHQEGKLQKVLTYFITAIETGQPS
jgi:Protein of unknown function (DUF2384)